MTSRRSDQLEAFAGPLYFIAFLLIATPALDFLSGVFPLRLGNIEWRFATVGLLSGFLLTPLLGILLAILVAASSGHEMLQRVIAWTNLSVAVLLFCLMVPFLLDIVQLRSVVNAEAKGPFQAAAVKAVAKHLCFVAALFWLGRRGLTLPMAPAPQGRRHAAVVLG